MVSCEIIGRDYRCDINGLKKSILHSYICRFFIFTTSIQKLDRQIYENGSYLQKQECWKVYRGWTGMTCWFLSSVKRWRLSRRGLDRCRLGARLEGKQTQTKQTLQLVNVNIRGDKWVKNFKPAGLSDIHLFHLVNFHRKHEFYFFKIAFSYSKIDAV